MAKFLVTGARAPATLEIVRNLGQHGHQVYLADSLKYPISRNSRFVHSYHQIPAPKNNLSNYKDALNALLIQHEIDYLLPTCEEVFYISKLKDELEKNTSVLCSDIGLLKSLHSKSEIFKCSLDCCIQIPQTNLLTQEFINELSEYSSYVLKRMFCRFGSDVVVSPSRKQIKQAMNKSQEDGFSVDNSYLIQERIAGQEICCYAIVNYGVVNLCVCYFPKYRLSQSASIYFESIEEPVITHFVKQLSKKHNFTGQISFDFIRNDKGVYLLECNPRATSGVHLCRDVDLASAFIEKRESSWSPATGFSVQIKLAMLLFIFPRKLLFNTRSLIADYRQAIDAININNDKNFLIYTVRSFLEIIVTAIKNKQSLRDATTRDIEWDGGSFNDN